MTDHEETSRAPGPQWPEMYRELRDEAERLLRRESKGHTLQPTALVHELFLRVQRDRRFRDADQSQILAYASRSMRDVLVDHARRKKSLRRGGGQSREPLEETLVIYEERASDLLALNEALIRLERLDGELARLVELRFFGGLTEVEAAEALGCSERSVRRSWQLAKHWLARELRNDL
ncbi:MAG: ECF-type sigma factor [Planctomycetota bacterium]